MCNTGENPLMLTKLIGGIDLRTSYCVAFFGCVQYKARRAHAEPEDGYLLYSRNAGVLHTTECLYFYGNSRAPTALDKTWNVVGLENAMRS
jgi:hypothetical protein